MSQPTFMIVYDDPAIRRLMDQILIRRYPAARIIAVATVAAALDHLGAATPSVVLTDYHLADGNALALIAAARGRTPTLPILVFSTDHAAAVDILAAGTCAVFPKPFDLNAVLAKIDSLLHQS